MKLEKVVAFDNGKAGRERETRISHHTLWTISQLYLHEVPSKKIALSDRLSIENSMAQPWNELNKRMTRFFFTQKPFFD